MSAAIQIAGRSGAAAVRAAYALARRLPWCRERG
jgi:hypothetical protein